MAGRYSAKRCTGKTAYGKPCRAYAQKGSSKCIFHAGKFRLRQARLVERRKSANKKRSTRGGGRRFRK